METSRDPISIRVSKLNCAITSYSNQQLCPNLSRDDLLDTLQVMYDECLSESLQEGDKHILRFVKKYKNTIQDVKSLRVNITDFEISKVIGRGHFGEVHLVKEIQTGDVYAMKRIRKSESIEKETSFIEERDIMAFSTSVWLTSLRYAFQDSSHLYYIMEYYSGGDLFGLLQKHGGFFVESVAIFYLAEMLLGLEDLHKMGYTHRDLKPENILVDRCGHLKIADFGSAARLNSEGYVSGGPPVGTPDYVAPEVLQSMQSGKAKKVRYDVLCDFWSLGVIGYELIFGNTPFASSSTTELYSKIMSYNTSLKFPAEVFLSLDYILFIKHLITDQSRRYNGIQIRGHKLFKGIQFETLSQQLPPYVPKVSAKDDTSNFVDIQPRTRSPLIESFKRRNNCAGRNLPFIGFSFTPDFVGAKVDFKKPPAEKEEKVGKLKAELETLKKKVSDYDNLVYEKKNIERKLHEKCKSYEHTEFVRNTLEKEVATVKAEGEAIKRALDLEHKDRIALEAKALDIIKAAKIKWETAERQKIKALNLEMEQQKEAIAQLSGINALLNEQIENLKRLENKNKHSVEQIEKLGRKSVIGLESRLHATEESVSQLQLKLNQETSKNHLLEEKNMKFSEAEHNLSLKLMRAESKYSELKHNYDEAVNTVKELQNKVVSLESEHEEVNTYKEQNGYLQEKLDFSQKVMDGLASNSQLVESQRKALDVLQAQVDELSTQVMLLQDQLRTKENLEVELQSEKEKNKALLEQYQLSSALPDEKQTEFKELRLKWWRTQKELDNTKFDLKMLERQQKEVVQHNLELVKELDDVKKLIENQKQGNSAIILELQAEKKALEDELDKLKKSYDDLQKMLADEEIKCIAKNDRAKELQVLTETKERDLYALNARCEQLENSMQIFEQANAKLTEKYNILVKEKQSVVNDLEKCKIELANKNLNFNALREACTMLDGQVVEYEKVTEVYQQKIAELKAKTDKLLEELCSSKKETQEVRNASSEEKFLRHQAENKTKLLTSEYESLKNECESYKSLSARHVELYKELSEKLAQASEEISDLKTACRLHTTQIEEMSCESAELREDISAKISELHDYKELNRSLYKEMESLKMSANMMMENEDHLKLMIQEKTAYYIERDLRSSATIAQQIKLIDFLHAKIDELTQKKKSLSGKLFGISKKENNPPLSLSTKDLENQLQEEISLNKVLQKEIYSLKVELASKDGGSSLKAKYSKMEGESRLSTPDVSFTLEPMDRSPSARRFAFSERSYQSMQPSLSHR